MALVVYAACAQSLPNSRHLQKDSDRQTLKEVGSRALYLSFFLQEVRRSSAAVDGEAAETESRG